MIYELFFPIVCLGCGKNINKKYSCDFAKENLCYLCYRLFKEEDSNFNLISNYAKSYLNRVLPKHYFMFVNLGLKKNLLKQAKLHPSFLKFKLLLNLYEKYLDELLTSDLNFDLLCYIPDHWQSLLIRGFSPTAEIAKWLSRKSNKAVISQAIVFQKKVKKQMRLKKQERVKNMLDAFKVSTTVKNKDILLIDDVVTTGSTLISAKNELLGAGASKVTTFSLAVSPLMIKDY